MPTPIGASDGKPQSGGDALDWGFFIGKNRSVSRYRAIDVRIWFDDKFPKLSDDAKLLFFFLISNPRGTMLGIAVQGKSDIAEFLGWPMKRLVKPFAELLQERLFMWDEKSRTVYLPHFLKYNPIENENQAKAAIKCIDDIPQNCPFFQDVKRLLERLAKPFHKPLLERLPERLPKQEEEPEEGEEPKINIPPDEKNGLLHLGEFKKVFLTKVEYEKLILRFGETKAVEWIEALDNYIASKGKRFKNHYATILNWSKRKQEQEQWGTVK